MLGSYFFAAPCTCRRHAHRTARREIVTHRVYITCACAAIVLCMSADKKKLGLDTSDVSNYRPISNLKVISKLLQRLVASQLTAYLTDNKLLPDHQSAYRAFCSTETVIARVLSDYCDRFRRHSRTPLDLSTAFDTVDHSVLLRRLQRSYGLNGSALAWFGSYMNQRQQHVTHRGVESATTTTQFGVPQSSVLGPILFVLYTADVVRLVQLHGFSVHQYADDTQIYGCCHPDNSASLCGDDVARWMCSNRLHLNARKTKFMWCVPPRRRHQLPVDQLTVQSTTVASRESVRDLGVYLDSDMSMHKHVTQLVCSCYGVLRQLRSIRRSLPRTALTTLVSSFIMSKVDYCKVVLAGLPQLELLDRVHSRSSTRLPACQQTLASTTT